MNAPQLPEAFSKAQQFLRRGQPFSRMDQEHVDWLAARLQEQSFFPDEVILAPGQSPDRLYFLASGQVRLEAMGDAIAEENRILAELIEGESFPLEALHDRRPAFATFRALTGVLCYTLVLDDFVALEKLSPIFRDFCENRAAAFLDSSRRIFKAHFARKAEDAGFLATRLDSLKCRSPQICHGDALVSEVIVQLDASGESSVVVIDAESAPVGVFTLHDLLRRVLIAGGDLSRPVSEVMNRALIALPPEADGYEAALAMAQYGVRQVLIVDQGRLIGAVSEHDLFTVQRVALSQLSERIRNARDTSMLQVLAEEIRMLSRNLMVQGLAAEPLTRIISSLNDRLTRRVIEMQVQLYAETLPDFCWIAIGSEGRHEQTLCTDQDNGIIFDAPGADTDAMREQLLPLARKINDALAECGFPLCKGGVMAGNPEWCLSLAEWKKKFRSWLEQPSPKALLNASIFFDFRPLFGDDELSQQLSGWLLTAAPGKDQFFHNFIAQALQRTPPIGFFRDFVVGQDAKHPDVVDLKLSGATLFVDAARILGLKAGVAHSSTAKRLSLAAEAMHIGRAEADAWVEAFHFIQMLRLRRQYELLEQGEEPHNRINPYELNDLDRKVFLEALRQARKLQKCLEVRFGVSR